MGAKRFGADQLSPQKKRKQDVDTTAKAFAKIVDGVKSGDAPSEVSELLIETARIAFGVEKENRHKFQHEVVDMVEKLLNTRDVALEKGVEDLQKQVSEDTQSSSLLESEVSEAQKFAEQRSNDVKPAKHTLADSTSAYREAKDRLDLARDAQVQGEFELKEAASKKILLDDTVRDLGRPLIEGAVVEDEMIANVEKFMKVMKRFSFDAAMMTALQTALSKMPPSRGPFDACVVTQFDEAVRERIRSFEEILNAGQATKKSLEASVAEAKQRFQSSLTDLKSNARVLEDAQAAKEAGDLAVSEAKQNSNVQLRQTRQRQRELNEATAEMELFRDGPLTAFGELREFTAPLKDIEGVEDTNAVMQAAAQEAGA